MLLVVEPLAFVHAPVCVHKYAEAVCFASHPLSLVDVSVHMSHPSLPAVDAVFSLALIETSVTELDDPESFPNCDVLCPPLAFVLFLL